MTTFGLECPICFGNLSGPRLVTSTNCGHLFHEDCLSSWLLKASTCPLCIKPVRRSLQVEVHLPNNRPSEIQKSSSSPVDKNTGLSRQFPGNELHLSALQSRRAIAPHQLQAVHSKLDKDYKNLRIVHEARALERDTLQCVSLILTYEKECLKKQVEANELSMARKKILTKEPDPDDDSEQPKPK